MMRNSVRGGALAAVLLAAVLLTGCGSRTGMQQPVTELTCAAPAGYPTMLAAGGYEAALCWTDAARDESHVVRLDVRRDRLSGQRTLEGAWELVEETFRDGRLALWRWDEDSNALVYRFLNKKLDDLGTFTPEEWGGQFSHDGAYYYFLRDGVLYRQTVDGGASERVPLEQDLRFTYLSEIHPTEDVLAAWCMLSPYGGESGTALLELSSGGYRMLSREPYTVSFTEQGICASALTDGESNGFALRYDDGNGVYRLAHGAWFGNDAMDLQPVKGSHYTFSSGETGTALFRLGETVARYDADGELIGICWLPEAQVLLGSVFEQDAYRLTVLDPAQLPFTDCGAAEEIPTLMTVESGVAEAYRAVLAGPALPEELAPLRAYADRLEETYSVNIRLSAQCAAPCTATDREIVTTDQAGLADEAASIRRSLEALEQALSRYPEGFFAQFRTALGEGGIQFLPVAAFHMDYDVIGLSFESTSWHHIAYQVDTAEPVELLCHEIWHATEDKLTAESWNAIDSDAWDACNPEGFAYSYDYDTAMWETDSRWLYLGTAEDVHFVDAYAAMEPREDRARIMEFIVGSEADAAELVQYPAIRQKLAIMSAAVRAGFDTTGWDIPRWEQPLAAFPDAA